MNVAKLKKWVGKITPEDRLFLERYLAQLRRDEDPEYADEIARRQRDMDEGKKVRWKGVKKLHRQMAKQGL
jgi:hypothetical protein